MADKTSLAFKVASQIAARDDGAEWAALFLDLIEDMTTPDAIREDIANGRAMASSAREHQRALRRHIVS